MRERERERERETSSYGHGRSIKRHCCPTVVSSFYFTYVADVSLSLSLSLSLSFTASLPCDLLFPFSLLLTQLWPVSSSVSSAVLLEKPHAKKENQLRRNQSLSSFTLLHFLPEDLIFKFLKFEFKYSVESSWMFPWNYSRISIQSKSSNMVPNSSEPYLMVLLENRYMSGLLSKCFINSSFSYVKFYQEYFRGTPQFLL